MTVHHGVLITTPGNVMMYGHMDSATPSDLPAESLLFYNNTCYTVGSGNPALGIFWQGAGTAKSPSAGVTQYNNLWLGGPGANGNSAGIVGLGTATGAVVISDYNYYAGAANPIFTYGTGTADGVSATYTGLAAVRTAKSIETHSTAQASTSGICVSLGGAQAPTGYKLASGSAAASTGSTTGLSTGSSCDPGAYGYDPSTGSPNSTVGCNF
jgi:hypothetical protein